MPCPKCVHFKHSVHSFEWQTFPGKPGIFWKVRKVWMRGIVARMSQLSWIVWCLNEVSLSKWISAHDSWIPFSCVSLGSWYCACWLCHTVSEALECSRAISNGISNTCGLSWSQSQYLWDHSDHVVAFIFSLIFKGKGKFICLAQFMHQAIQSALRKHKNTLKCQRKKQENRKIKIK